MANISQYVFSNLITVQGQNPDIYIDDYGTLYSAFAYQSDDIGWIDLYYSTYAGVTWERDNELPTNEKLQLNNPKVVVSNDIYYILATGTPIDVSTGKKAIYIIRKYTNLNDNGETTSEDFWDDNYTKLIYNSKYNCRLRDVKLDAYGFYIFITYDREITSGNYEARFAVYGISDFKLKMDVSLNDETDVNQHNARLCIIDSETVGFTWEIQHKTKYDGMTYQIAYRQYSLTSEEFTDMILVSDDEVHNNYHQSICADSTGIVYVAWLNTKEHMVNNITPQYYDTNNIVVATISTGKVSSRSTITTEAKENEYPYILTDTSDNLYILYTKQTSVEYLTKKVDSNEWVNITNLEDSDWKLLIGISNDDNLYTITRKDNQFNYMTRIDTNLAEVFKPVDDFQIYDVDEQQIGFAWTMARNAEKIVLQERIDDYKAWNYVKANTTTTITPTADATYIVGLKANTRYCVKLTYDTSDGKSHVQYFPTHIVTQNESDNNMMFMWTVHPSTIKQTLYVGEELWVDALDVPTTTNNIAYTYNDKASCYRLNITGGVADGYSNEASPLTISLKDNKDYVLSWTEFKNATYIELQQSIDGKVYYRATKQNLKVTDTTCTLTNINNVTYQYRLMYVKDNSMNYSNIVSLTNNLKAVTVGYNSATIHWTTVDPKEPVKFQVSTDGGSTWFIKVYNIDKKQSTATLRNLDFDTEYQIKLLFPERYTGKNSNILTFKTEKHPIEKITLSSLNSLDSLHLKFNTGKTFSNIELELVEIYGNVKTTIPYTNMDNLTKKNINASTVCIEGDITGLKKGTYYSVRAHALGSKYGYSSYSKSANTIGDNPQGFSVASVGQHEVELKWNALDRIPTGDTREFVMITYTKDNVLYDSVTVSIINTPFRIDDLEQDTTYKFKMFCYYGDNYGESSEVTVTTGADIYPALNGERLNDETCMAYSSVDDNFYIFDKGILYSYNKTTKAQAIVKDYNLKTNHAYGDIKTDKNGKVHLLFTADKCVYYATNCNELKDDGTIVTHSLTDAIKIVENPYANDYLYPNMVIDMLDNNIYMTWQSDYGNFADIDMYQYRNGVAVSDKPFTVFNDNKYNNLPKIRMTGDGGWIVAAIDNDGDMKIGIVDVDNDFTSNLYLQSSLSLSVCKLKNPCLNPEYNNFDIWVDNLGTIRVFYDSYDSNGNKSSTYAVYDQDKEELSNIVPYSYGMHDTTMYENENSFIMIGKNNIGMIFTANYIVDEKNDSFSDLTQLNLIADENMPLVTCYDGKDVHVLSRKAGMWKVDSIDGKRIVDNGNTINGICVSKPVMMQDADSTYIAMVWTTGEPEEYPQMFIKVNEITRNITPTDEFGYPNNQKIYIDSIIEDTAKKQSVIITYNTTETITLDVSSMLSYNWNKSKIINELSSN